MPVSLFKYNILQYNILRKYFTLQQFDYHL